MNMKTGILRKIYPYLNNTCKDIKWRSITDAELEALKQERQVISNCYEESVRYSLINSLEGRKLLRKRIKVENRKTAEPAYKISLNINGKNENYRSSMVDYYGKYASIYRDYFDTPLDFINSAKRSTSPSLGINIAISKMIRRHPSQKPLISRLYMFPLISNRLCEHNKPSNAFKWFTGKNPIEIGETTLSLTLKNKEKEVRELLNNINPLVDSFVCILGSKKIKGIDKWHCLPIIGVNKETQTLDIINKRNNNVSTFTFDEFIGKFKAIVGIKYE